MYVNAPFLLYVKYVVDKLKFELLSNIGGSRIHLTPTVVDVKWRIYQSNGFTIGYPSFHQFDTQVFVLYW